MTDIKEYIKGGNVADAVATAKAALRDEPASPEARIALFQLLCVEGEWDKARTQLDVLADLGATPSLFATIFREVVEAERVRERVFAAGETPVVVGEPSDWVAWLVEANRLVTCGGFEAAALLRASAFEAAPAVGGTLNGTAFEWVADADPRIGPVLEAILDGGYRWVPFQRIRELRMEAPTDLRDLVWAPATITWTEGASASVFLPVRYPGIGAATPSAERLSRSTSWIEKPSGYYLGSGQKVLATDASEIPMLEIRELVLGGAVA